jgi:hypothetical protein
MFECKEQYTPKDFDIARIMREIATLADNRRRTNA